MLIPSCTNVTMTLLFVTFNLTSLGKLNIEEIFFNKKMGLITVRFNVLIRFYLMIELLIHKQAILLNIWWHY